MDFNTKPFFGIIPQDLPSISNINDRSPVGHSLILHRAPLLDSEELDFF